VFAAGSAKNKRWVRWELNGHLMASCVRDIRTKSYQNLIIGFQVTVENVWDVFLNTVYNIIYKFVGLSVPKT